MTVILALLDTVSQQPQVGITTPPTAKWPNDLYLGDRKAGGILIQNALSGTSWQSAIVGIGLNVNQTVFPISAGRPTSLALTAGHSFNTEVIAGTLFECVERRYLQLKSGHRLAIRQEYESRLFRRGLLTDFQRANGEKFQGVITGVQADGRLSMDTTRGSELFSLKEVTLSKSL